MNSESHPDSETTTLRLQAGGSDSKLEFFEGGPTVTAVMMIEIMNNTTVRAGWPPGAG